jgi:CubicO group peptidase (beta-lactamase class C family)
MKVKIISIFLLFSFFRSYGQSLDIQLQDIANEYDIAGMSVAVIKEGQIVYNQGFGMADFGQNLPVTDSTDYRIASVSKMVTAVGFMQLYEQGLVSLDANISNILGYQVKNPHFPAIPITPRMLLSHTSTIVDGNTYNNFLADTYNELPPPDMEELLNNNGSYYSNSNFLNKQPGTYFQYSNLNYGIIGTLIEKISGVRFDEYMRMHVLEPMGIYTGFNVYNLPDISNLAVLYRKQNGNWVPQADNYGGNPPTSPDYSGYTIGSNGLLFAPQGGLRISAPNIAKMAIMLTDGTYNCVPILHDSTAQRMKTVQWTYNGTNGNNYYGLFRSWGLGLQRTTNTNNADIVCPAYRMWGHAGEAYGLVSDVYFNDTLQTGVVFITNGCGVGYDTPPNSAFYEVEADVFAAVCAALPDLVVPPAVVIEGESTVCAEGVHTYTTPLVEGAVYTWTITGGTILSGQGTPEILVQWNNVTNGTVNVVVEGP